jgi:arsenite-transporting ATPase
MEVQKAGAETRIILYSGKGGVGKTSVAAATALHCAELGYRTLVMSTDAAHSLSDSFDLTIGPESSPIADNLWGQETNLNITLDKNWTTIRKWVSALLAWRGLQKIMADEIAILPGMEELANLLYIVDYAQNGDYDAIIVDCAPTGETLRLLSFPEILNWWMEKLFPIEREAIRVIRPVLKPLLHVPVPDEEVFNSIEELFPQLKQMRALLTNFRRTSMRLVLNPEKMVIKETQRTFTYLNLYNYFTDLIICNRFIPETITDHYFDYWKANQEYYYHTIEERFAPLPILTIPLMEREVVGFDMLRAMAHALYHDQDPTRFFYRGKTHHIEKQNSHYTLSFELPYTTRDEISLIRNGDELIINVGTYRRNIILPRTLVNLPVVGARFDNDKLVIRFGEEPRRENRQTL